MRDVVLVSAARTPIGSFLGALAAVPAPKLGAIAIQAALERAKLDPGAVDMVYMGAVLPAGQGQAPARQAALGAGLPQGVPCVTVNKVCGSGLETILLAARAIAVGDAEVVVAGGMESMSNAPHLVRGLRAGVKMGGLDTVDSMVHDGLWDVYSNQHMGNCAELCAKDRGISRGAQDEFAAESYRRALAAQQAGHFAAEIAAVKLPGKGGETVVDSDEEPGRGNIAKLGGLRPAFAKDGTITAGNASSLNDGAAAVVVMSAERAKQLGAPVLARIVANGYHAQAPEWFTTAPAAAIDKACAKAGWKPTAVDLWEINEAFSVVSIANNQLLGLDPAKVNVWGGAVALGHPIGASGTRIVATLLSAMAARGAKTGGASLCIGGGEGIALLLERP
ncbi:MAG: acetyl-CoA C-acetyltransferase [Kofleriaceae bacterium]|jgi:acetyl-CoA C-acetyltransferase|nr:acetyl-CoA C-acetyltransferase [Kofleriaceae bacterium]MBP9171112.1 acetyl-CoA C-acetyltransferase [Kofleriaceae bacterium]MBP9860884.1 acetyl-CoA C-acetyltransferase [Kofleriaceae bacterium]